MKQERYELSLKVADLLSKIIGRSISAKTVCDSDLDTNEMIALLSLENFNRFGVEFRSTKVSSPAFVTFIVRELLKNAA